MSAPKKVQIYFYRILYTVQVHKAGGAQELTAADEIAVEHPLRNQKQFHQLEQYIASGVKVSDNANGAALLGMPAPRVTIQNFWLLRVEKVPYEAWAAARTLPNGEKPPEGEAPPEVPEDETPALPEDAPPSVITTD